MNQMLRALKLNARNVLDGVYDLSSIIPTFYSHSQNKELVRI